MAEKKPRKKGKKVEARTEGWKQKGKTERALRFQGERKRKNSRGKNREGVFGRGKERKRAGGND